MSPSAMDKLLGWGAACSRWAQRWQLAPFPAAMFPFPWCMQASPHGRLTPVATMSAGPTFSPAPSAAHENVPAKQASSAPVLHRHVASYVVRHDSEPGPSGHVGNDAVGAEGGGGTEARGRQEGETMNPGACSHPCAPVLRARRTAQRPMHSPQPRKARTLQGRCVRGGLPRTSPNCPGFR